MQMKKQQWLKGYDNELLHKIDPGSIPENV